jgi:hypothetical protein
MADRLKETAALLAKAVSALDAETNRRKNAEAAAAQWEHRAKVIADQKDRDAERATAREKDLAHTNDVSHARERAGWKAFVLFVASLALSYALKSLRPVLYGGLGAAGEMVVAWWITDITSSTAWVVMQWGVCLAIVGVVIAVCVYAGTHLGALAKLVTGGTLSTSEQKVVDAIKSTAPKIISAVS